MHRTPLLSLFLLSLAPCALGQAKSTEPEGMQALVSEVRLLRKELQETNAYALKAQVLLYRLQVQEGAVARWSQRLNDLRAALATIQDRQRNLAATIKHYEKAANDSETSPTQRKEAEGQVLGLKSELESVATEEQERQASKIEAEDQLRAEQAKLGTLEEQLDRLAKDLDKPR